MKTGIGMFSNKNVIYEKELIRNSLLPLSCITAFLISFSFAGWKLATQKQRAAEAEAAPPHCRSGKAVNHHSRQRVGRGAAVQMLALLAGIKHVYTQGGPHPWCGCSIHWDQLLRNKAGGYLWKKLQPLDHVFVEWILFLPFLIWSSGYTCYSQPEENYKESSKKKKKNTHKN